MYQYYIQAPQQFQTITIYKGNPIPTLPLDAMPEDYKKHKFKNTVYETLLYLIGFTELIKRGMKL